MNRWVLAAALGALLGPWAAVLADKAAAGAAPKPVKVSSAEALGAVFSRPGAVKENGADGPATDYSMLKSRDGRFEAGVFEAGPSDQRVTAYETDEFMYFLEGGVTLTSTDGTVLEARAGEAVVVPKGVEGTLADAGLQEILRDVLRTRESPLAPAPVHLITASRFAVACRAIFLE